MSNSFWKTATRQSATGLPVFDISFASSGDYLDGVAEVFEVDQLPEAVELVTKVIHGIPKLFEKKEKIDLEHLKIYLGRTACDQFAKRMEAHFKTKGLPYAIPICIADNDFVKMLERFSIKFLKYLEKENRLCFGSLVNCSSGSAGRFSEDKSIIYLVFGIDRRSKAGELLESGEIDDAVRRVYTMIESDDVIDGEISLRELKQCFKETTKQHAGTKLYWYGDSRSNE